MSYISWSRAAYVFFVLAVLAALLKLGTSGFSNSEPLRQAAAKNSERIDSVEVHKQQTVEDRASGTGEEITEESTKPDSSSNPVEVRNGDASDPSVGVRTGDASIVPRETKNGTFIFYRPAKQNAAKSRNGAANGDAGDPASGLGQRPAFQSNESGPVCGDLSNVPKSSKAVFPLSDNFFNSYDDTWGAARPQGGHEGTDLMTPAETPEYAITDGTVVPVSGANNNGWNTLGGYTLMLRADYSVGPIQEGDLFYYAHMDRESSLKIGTRVQAGQLVGYAGDTGQGSEITRGLFPPHLHLGWYDASGARTDLASGAMNPYPLLEWIKSNGGAVSGGTDAKFCTAPQNSIPSPSTGEESWPIPNNPGESPDIDTGNDDAAPSPIVKRGNPNKAPDREQPRKEKTPDEKNVQPDTSKNSKPDSTDKKDQLPNKNGKRDKIDRNDRLKLPRIEENDRLKLPKIDDIIDRIRDRVNGDRGDRNDGKNNGGDAKDKNPPKKNPPKPNEPQTNEKKDPCKPERATTKNKTEKDTRKPKATCEEEKLDNPTTEAPTDDSENTEAPPTNGETPDEEPGPITKEPSLPPENPDEAGSDGEAPDGEAPDGEAPDGEAPDGEAPDGEAPDGEAPDGEAPIETETTAEEEAPVEPETEETSTEEEIAPETTTEPTTEQGSPQS